jgi:uncharacterized protein YndB with AHSA1/START domain
MAATTSGTAVVTTPTDTQILMVREFAAPKHLVFKVCTTPELIKRWWSGGMGEVTVADVDLRVGGTWRHVLVTAEGYEVGFHGEYQEIVPNERIVCTEIFEGMPGTGEGGGESTLCTYTFTEKDGRTTLTLVTECNSKETRDAIIASGMEQGLQAGWDLLEQIAVELS